MPVSAAACVTTSACPAPRPPPPRRRTVTTARDGHDAHDARDARDETALRAGLVALIPQLRLRAMRLCGDATTADDVVQDTIERALRFSHQYERGTNLRAWAQQVLFSVFVTRWRRRRRDRDALRRLAGDPHAWTVPVRFAAPDAGEGAMTLSTRRTLEALPAGFRDVIILVDLEQRTYVDAASALGVPVGTVMSRLHRGRKLLAERMIAQAA
jgi:RNA polymerase sigma-70 factor, ECF subfamily